jgi:hypothetical protein
MPGRGRKPPGPEIVDRLQGSPQAKRRLRAILQTVAGDQGVAQASADLNRTPQRFHTLRSLALQAALDALELGRAGRPRKRLSPPAERWEALERDHER